MVHALQEAQRVLAPGGRLLDLRPAAVHRRVGIRRSGRLRFLGALREQFDEDYAADRAVAEVVHAGLFKAAARAQFQCSRVMDRLEEFQDWLKDFTQRGGALVDDRTMQRMERALRSGAGRARIVVRGPLNLRVLRKPE